MIIGKTAVYDWIRLQDSRFVLLRGGAGSSKSHSLAQFIIKKAFTESNKTFMIFRKTYPSLRITCMPLILELLNEYRLPFQYNKTESLITIPNGSTIRFSSVDDPHKVKSANLNYVWLEEATELSFDVFEQLNLRMRGVNDLPNQMWMSFNPIGRTNWIYTELIEKNHPNIVQHISTYKDNPYLSQEYIDQLERLIDQDMNYYRVYTLGEWGELENIIYNNYRSVSTMPLSPDEVIYGVDFGFNNPSSIVKVYIKDQEYHLEELLYESRLTNSDLIDRMKELRIPSTAVVYADCAEPARIEEIYKAGFNIQPAVKDKNSVKDGIDFCKRHKLHVMADSVNLLKELSGYKYKEDKDGNILDEPVKFNDHLCDAFRYAIYTHEIQRGGTTEFYIE